MSRPPFHLDRASRALSERVAREVCDYKGWVRLAVNARTTHVHCVISAPTEPEGLLRTLKAWTTRRRVEASLLASGTKPWARHGSTVYLWTPDSRERAVWYVLYEQDAGPA